MSLSERAGTQTGFAKVVATEGRGLNPKELTDLTIGKIIRISDTANPVIKQQAEVFRDQLEAILMRAFRQAQMSERTTLYNLFKNQGHEDMAEIIKRL